MLFKNNDIVLNINIGFEKWVNIKAWEASSIDIIFWLYICFIFLADDGKPDIRDKKNIVIILSDTLNKFVNIFFIGLGI